MEAIPAWTKACAGCGDRPAVGERLKTATLDAVALRQAQTAELSIVTDEGDTVTISAEYRAEAAWLAYGQSAFGDGRHRRTEGEAAWAAFDQRISISVDGDLNDRERSDIEALLADLERMLEGFLAGAGGPPPVDAGRLAESSSLARVDAVLEYRASVEAAGFSARERTAPAGVQHPRAGKAPPVALATSAAEPAAGPPPPSVEPLSAAAADEAERVADRMARRVGRSGLGPRRLQRMLEAFLRRLLDDLRAERRIDAEGWKRGQGVVDRLLERLDAPEAPGEARSSRVSVGQASVAHRFELQFQKGASPALAQAS